MIMSGCSSPVTDAMCDDNCRPAGIGAYDMRVGSTRERSAVAAKELGAFIYVCHKSRINLAFNSKNASIDCETERAASAKRPNKGGLMDRSTLGRVDGTRKT